MFIFTVFRIENQRNSFQVKLLWSISFF